MWSKCSTASSTAVLEAEELCQKTDPTEHRAQSTSWAGPVLPWLFQDAHRVSGCTGHCGSTGTAVKVEKFMSL